MTGISEGALDMAFLRDKATSIRADIVRMVYDAGDGHPGPALSITDLVVALYYRVMNSGRDVSQPEGRDRFVLSKGHGCPALYAVLADLGFFEKKHLSTLRALNSILQGHPVMNKTPGVEMTSGSLGNGLSIGAGMAAALRYRKIDGRVFVLAGDGELNEGVVWEGALTAVQHKLDKLCFLVDVNGYQSGGTTDEISGIGKENEIKKKLEAFGMAAKVIDGHSIKEIVETCSTLPFKQGLPSALVCRTVKGKGVSFMENQNRWHKAVPTKEEFATAMAELERR